jgi:hypothetical protein
MEHPTSPPRRLDLRFHQTGGAARLCLLVLLAAAAPAAAQAPEMAVVVQGAAFSFDDCKARVSRALTAEGYGNLRDFGNGWLGFHASRSASVGCIHGSGETVLVITTAGPDSTPARDRLRALVMGGGAVSTGVSGQWRLESIVPPGQPYAGTYLAEMDLTEQGGVLSGRIRWYSGVVSTVSGELRNGEVVLHRVDDSGFRAVFQGRVTGEGRMEGTGYNDPSSPGGNSASYTWTAHRLP